jgi:endoglycosylceramidase
MARLWLALLLCLAAAKIIMNPDTRYFVDELGRSRLFHGLNVVVKGTPFIPITDHFDPQMSVSAEDIANLQTWGFNFIRLGVMWQAVETSPQVYNTTYLAEITTLINTLGAAGIYTLVDAHQDVFARKFCGEGVPDFYVTDLDTSCDYGPLSENAGCKTMESFNLEYDEDGFPTIESCLKHVFVEYYFTPEASSAFDNLYKNVNGIRDRFLDYWDVVIDTFKDNPYVLGYNPLNEPFNGNFFKDLTLWFPGALDHKVLQGLYQDFNKVTRRHTKDQIIFFEPGQCDTLSVLGGLVFPAGFDETPGGSENNAYQILNDHTYCCQASSTICSTGEPDINQAPLCRKFHENRVGTRSKDAKRLGVGLIISEFGACSASDACVTEINSVTEVCDENLVSWAYWGFKGFYDYTTSGSYTEGLYSQDGSLQTNKLKALARTYISAFQGVPLKMSFNSTSNDFYAEYEVDPSIQGPTEVSLSLNYPYGYLYVIENSLGLQPEVKETSNGLMITYASGPKSKTTLSIKAK